jgi:hypothetical protein
MIHSQSEQKVQPHPWPPHRASPCKEAGGQGRGGIQRHILLTHWGTSALSGQAFNRSDPDAPLPNGPVYHHSLMENEEIKCQIQELLEKGHI